MAATLSQSRNRSLKRFIVVAGSLVVILFASHLWFVYNARAVLKQYISEQSHGKIKLELSQLNLNLLSKRLQIREADLVSTDSLNEPITYHVAFSTLSLNVGSVWALLFQKKLFLDSLKLENPVIQVTQWRKDTGQVVVKDELSLPQEMGKFYNSLLSALDEFGVRRIIVENAKVSLINKMRPGSQPVTVSNIFFDLARAAIKKGNKNVYIKNKQTVELRTSNQNIVLPGGRHHLSFKSFSLHLFRKQIDLDSCTVTAIATDSLKSSYRVFFKKLSLAGVDFTALSTLNVIKADTVKCEDPFFDLNIYRSDAVKNKTEMPDPEKIIREMTGNLDLAFIGVKNAGINLNVYGKTKRSFLNSNKDNFQIHGFRINPDSSQPISIKRFDMTLRDYHVHNEDSSSTFSFDSLHFLNSKVVLNNFAIHSKSGRNKLRNEINIKVPFFELSQLDWYQLVFEQNLVAKAAVLNNPFINFTRVRTGPAKRKLKLFAALQNLDSLLALENVTVINGRVNMKLGPEASFNIQNLDFDIYSNKLLGSKNKESLQKAVNHLWFSKGVLRLKDVTAELQNASFTGRDLLYADKVTVTDKANKIAATVNKVHVDNMQLDDNAETIDVDGLEWESATVALLALPAEKSNNKGSSINLRNIAANKTRLRVSTTSTSLSAFVETLDVAQLIKKPNESVKVKGLLMTGRDLALNSNTSVFKANSYYLSSDESSTISGMQWEQLNGQDSSSGQSPKLNFTANFNELFGKNLHFTKADITAPVIKLSKRNTASIASDTITASTTIRIDKLTATEPDIIIATYSNDSVATFNIPRSYNGLVQASDILLSPQGIRLTSLNINTGAATFVKSTGEKIGVEKGLIDIKLSDLYVGRKNGKMNWKGFINNISLENANGFRIGKTKNYFGFQSASLGNINVSSDYLPDFERLTKANASAWLRIPKGQLVNNNTTMHWYNANYDNSSKMLRLDSFVYHPTKSLDSVLAHAPFQLDYITLKTGAVTISGLDVASYKKDASFIANTIKVSEPVLTVYRDKKPGISPYKKTRELPAILIKNLSVPVVLQGVTIADGTITYTEKNRLSRKEATLLLTQVNGTVENIKNRRLSGSDSLSLILQARLMDSAHITLKLKESYTDSLGGFVMSAKVRGADLSVINPFLAPLADVKITSGILDSVSFRVIGREDVALGEMKMHYNKLRIRLIKDGDTSQSSFMQNMASFVANTFVIRGNNSKRKGVMYYNHLSRQSFISYIVKTTLSGLSSSMGLKKNRKYLKQYKQELKASRMPPISL